MLINLYSGFGVISVTCSECISPYSRCIRAPDPIHPVFFVLRTYALWNKNRMILVVMSSTLFAIFVSFNSIWFSAIATSNVMTSTIPGITGCYRSSRSVQFFMPFLLIFVLQLGLASLSLTCAIKSWRSAKGPLHAILMKHNIFYYVCSLFLSTVNILVPILFSDSAYYSVFEDLEVFILAILATRMHLHLWHIDRPYGVMSYHVAYSASFVETT
ncbi:hypothetical protein DEU56DRAFT_90942 [Suillus clintonianus]|uniref:uncharacterized protein n=1 Tax=Suillus clintonianus TaxID=1904413 RepID=UPI001B87B238|nr:uncharacterized protein DEU56DRAFT_90942 [Suillus clintonianus]KAG2121874.1 hypothetical protein DEU56DRAFT_90942 [Suillus clintonianus]